MNEERASAARTEHRAVRSFVLRQGRMTPSQARALDELWPRYGLALTPRSGEGAADPKPLDLDQVFGRHAERVLEIGFGNGEALLASAQADPARDWIGVEVHGPGVGRLLNKADAAGLGNLRVFQHDAVEVLQQVIADRSLAEIRVFFPDPWPKKKHHKRRLIQPALVALLHRKLAVGGRLHLATDWPAYAEHMLEVMEAAPGWRNQAGAGCYSERPASRPLTHFEQRGLRLGHPVFDLLYEVVGVPGDDAGRDPGPGTRDPGVEQPGHMRLAPAADWFRSKVQSIHLTVIRHARLMSPLLLPFPGPGSRVPGPGMPVPVSGQTTGRTPGRPRPHG